MSTNKILNFGQWLAENKRTPMGARLNEAEGTVYDINFEIKNSEYTPNFLNQLKDSLLGEKGSFWTDSKTDFSTKLVRCLSNINVGRSLSKKLEEVSYSDFTGDGTFAKKSYSSDDTPYLASIITVTRGKIENPSDKYDPNNYTYTTGGTTKKGTGISEELLKASSSLYIVSTNEEGEEMLKPTKIKELVFARLKFSNTDKLMYTQELQNFKNTDMIDLSKIKCYVWGEKSLQGVSIAEAMISPKGGNERTTENFYTSTESYKKGVTDFIASISKEKEKSNKVPVLLAVKNKLPGCETVEDAVSTAKGKGKTPEVK